MGCGASKANATTRYEPIEKQDTSAEAEAAFREPAKVAANSSAAVSGSSLGNTLAGERLLNHAKTLPSGGPLLSQLSFVLHAVAKAAQATTMLKSDAMLFASCALKLEELLLLTTATSLEVHKASFLRLMDLLEEGAQHLKRLVGGSANAAAPRLAVEHGYKVGQLRATSLELKDACATLAPPGADAALLTIFDDLRFRQSEKLDAAVTHLRTKSGAEAALETDDSSELVDSDAAAELYSLQLEKQAAERLASATAARASLLEKQEELLQQQLEELNRRHLVGLKASVAAERFPMPPNEAERRVGIDAIAAKLAELPNGPVEPIEAVMRELVGAMSGSCGSMALTMNLDHLQRFLSLYIRDPDSPSGVAFMDTATCDVQTLVPRKLTACQYVVATGEMACYRTAERHQREMLPSIVQGDPSVTASLEPGGHLHMMRSLDAGTTQKSPAAVKAHRMLAESMYDAENRYFGIPVPDQLNTIAVLCAVFRGVEPGEADKQRMAEAAEKLGGILKETLGT